MALNLVTKYAKQFEQAFLPESYFAGKTSTKFSFKGTKEIIARTPVLVDLNDYTRSGANRYGTPSEIDDVMQVMTLAFDKGFTKTLDRGNYQESDMLITAGQWMSEEIRGKVTPYTEKEAVKKWVRDAGIIRGASAAVTESTIAKELSGLITEQKNKYVKGKDIYLYISESSFETLLFADQIIGNDAMGERAIAKGQAGYFRNTPVVPIPDDFFPENCYAFLGKKESMLLPRTIEFFKIHSDPPGINGWLMEGRARFDAFVVGAKADGVAALVLGSSKQATPTVTYTAGSTNTVAITSANATTIKYTIDGTDPRYSTTAKTYSAAISTADWASGKHVVKAVAYRTGGYFTSDVKTQEVTIA